jgi:predicted DNA-binding transcriptional regulator YafY
MSDANGTFCPMPSPQTPAKVQRWIDLVAALLRRHYPVPFDTIAHEVPAYALGGKKPETVMRMFERDKDELRVLGVPIEAVNNEQGTPDQYRLSSRNFYLPYLQLVGAGTAPRRPKGYGYQSLPVLAFEPDELEAIVRAATRAQQLGDPVLAREAASALRKLAFDLAVTAPTNEIARVDASGDDPTVLDVLDDAIRRRKRIDCEYWSIGRDTQSSRALNPLGLVFAFGQWYLDAVEVDSTTVKRFRVSRILQISVNTSKPQTPDFDRPADFDLSARAASKLAWELSDGDVTEAIVRFNKKSGFANEASRLGEPVPGRADCRRFRVRRLDTFTRWLLSLAGDAVPLEPPAVIAAWQEAMKKTLTTYGAAS